MKTSILLTLLTINVLQASEPLVPDLEGKPNKANAWGWTCEPLPAEPIIGNKQVLLPRTQSKVPEALWLFPKPRQLPITYEAEITIRNCKELNPSPTKILGLAIGEEATLGAGILMVQQGPDGTALLSLAPRSKSDETTQFQIAENTPITVSVTWTGEKASLTANGETKTSDKCNPHQSPAKGLTAGGCVQNGGIIIKKIVIDP